MIAGIIDSPKKSESMTTIFLAYVVTLITFLEGNYEII